jgi:hypothetical protein
MKTETEGDVVTRKVFVKFTETQLNEINAAHMDATLMLEGLTGQVKVIKGSILSMQAAKKERRQKRGC